LEAIENTNKYTLSGDLSKIGMHTSVWTTARKIIDEDNLYKFVVLATYEWFDDRLLRICKVRLSWLWLQFRYILYR
jgi:hypothetical protein